MKRTTIGQRDKGFITKDGIKRIVRDRNLSAMELQAKAVETTHHKQQKITNPSGYIFALVMIRNGATDTLDAEVLYTARYLAQSYGNYSVIALVCGDIDTDPGLPGADSSIQIDYDLKRHYQPELLVELIEELYKKYHPKHIIGGESDWGDSDILRRFAIKMQLEFAHQVIAIEGDNLVSQIDSQQEAKGKLPPVFAICGDITAGDIETRYQNTQLENPGFTTNAVNAYPVNTLPIDQIALPEAPLICSAGNGVEDMDLFIHCAEALGASIGASRVVTDAGRLPRDRQVGATGVSVSAQVYLCFGISGAVQHLQGIRECNTVIAVNTDPGCPMIQRADLSFIADAGDVMRAIIEELQQEVTE